MSVCFSGLGFCGLCVWWCNNSFVDGQTDRQTDRRTGARMRLTGVNKRMKVARPPLLDNLFARSSVIKVSSIHRMRKEESARPAQALIRRAYILIYYILKAWPRGKVFHSTSQLWIWQADTEFFRVLNYWNYFGYLQFVQWQRKSNKKYNCFKDYFNFKI